MAPKKVSTPPRRRRRQVPGRRSRPQCLQIALPVRGAKSGFGFAPKLNPRTDLYLASSGGTGSVTTNTELGLKVVDFFDYTVTDKSGSGVAQTVTNYFWDCNQNLFANGQSSSPFTDNDQTFCRVRSLEVYVLPAKGFEIGPGAGPNTNNAQGMFTVQAQVPATGTGGTKVVASDTQVTNILPQIDTFWKRVLKCDLQKTFQSGVMRPAFNAPDLTGAINQCLFQMSIVDPTDGSSYLGLSGDSDNLQIRVKVVLHVDQPIATIQNAKIAVFKNESFLSPSLNQNGDPFPGTTEQYVQTNLERVRNNMR